MKKGKDGTDVETEVMPSPHHPSRERVSSRRVHSSLQRGGATKASAFAPPHPTPQRSSKAAPFAPVEPRPGHGGAAGGHALQGRHILAGQRSRAPGCECWGWTHTAVQIFFFTQPPSIELWPTFGLRRTYVMPAVVTTVAHL